MTKKPAKKATKKLVKPVPVSKGEYLDFNPIMRYIEDKYGIQHRGYTPKNGFTKKQLDDERTDKPYLDFWHWVLELNVDYEVHNGGTLWIDFDDDDAPDWVKEILELIRIEFDDQIESGYMTCWISW